MTAVRHVRRSLLPPLVAAALLCSGCATPGSSTLGWNGDDADTLSAWLDTELEPYLVDKLTKYPRFKGETITVATMTGDDLRPASDALAASIVERVNEFLLAAGGIRLVWDGGREAGDCTRREDAHYVIAIDLRQTSPASHRLSVRALDREEGLWVSGFGRQWDGRLTRGEYARFRQEAHGEDARGLRDSPFSDGETDLLARHLAAQLGGRFCGFVGEPLVVYPVTAAEAPPLLTDTVDLVANNLARSPHIRVADDADRANLLLSGSLYAVEGELHQFWVQARPADDRARFDATDVQAYVRLPRTDSEQSYRNGTSRGGGLPPPAAVAGDPVAVAAFRVLTPNEPWMCRRADPWSRGARVVQDAGGLHADDCFALEIEVRGDAEVFLLRRDARAGLVRQLPGRCGRFGGSPFRVQGGGVLRFPSFHVGRSDALRPPPGALEDTWAVLAVDPSLEATALRRHLGSLPDDCAAADGASVDADTWFAELRSLVRPGAGSTDFRFLRIRVDGRSASLGTRP